MTFSTSEIEAGLIFVLMTNDGEFLPGLRLVAWIWTIGIESLDTEM